MSTMFLALLDRDPGKKLMSIAKISFCENMIIFNFEGVKTIYYNLIAFYSDELLTDTAKKRFSSLYSEYPVCESKYFTQALCGQYPSWQQCGCPLRAGEVHLKNIQYTLPDLGVLGAVVAVSIFKCPYLTLNMLFPSFFCC